MNADTPQPAAPAWVRRGLEKIATRTGNHNLTIGEGRIVHAPREGTLLGVRVFLPLCSSSPALGPLVLSPTTRPVTCHSCAKIDRNLQIPDQRQPTLF